MLSCSRKIFVLFFLCTYTLNGQELPVLSPEQTSSYFFNPSFAGHNLSKNITYSLVHNQSLRNITDHPSSTLFTVDFPLAKYHIGGGAKISFERVNFLQTIHLAFTFAYHINVSNHSRLSFGLEPDFYYLSIDHSRIKAYDPNQYDPVLYQDEINKVKLDFSGGVNYLSKSYHIGLSINNINSAFTGASDRIYGTYYSTAFTNFFIPVHMKRDLLEPQITLRFLPHSVPVGSVGLYYSFKEKNSIGLYKEWFLRGGLSVSTNKTIGFLFGIKVLNRIRLSYYYQDGGNYRSQIGNSHEIVLQISSLNMSYMQRNTEYLNLDNLKLRLKRKIK